MGEAQDVCKRTPAGRTRCRAPAIAAPTHASPQPTSPGKARDGAQLRLAGGRSRIPGALGLTPTSLQQGTHQVAPAVGRATVEDLQRVVRLARFALLAAGTVGIPAYLGVYDAQASGRPARSITETGQPRCSQRAAFVSTAGAMGLTIRRDSLNAFEELSCGRVAVAFHLEPTP